MNKIIEKIVNYITKKGGTIVETSNGYDQEFSRDDMENLLANKYVLPYVLFTASRESFLEIGEKCIQFNMESKDAEKFINWKVIVFEFDKDKALFCLSATTNRMDLHDPSVVTGLTMEKRSELLKTSLLLLSDFNEFLTINVSE